MKNRLLFAFAVAFVVAVALLAFTACGSNEQSLDGMIIVTFQFNGGVLDTGSTNVTEKIFHAYYPNDYVIDISQKFSFERDGYVFDGWYKDEQLTEEWKFSTPVTENATLYAKWKSKIVYSYTVYLADGDNEPRRLGRYEVEEGAVFSDTRNFGTALSALDKTFLGYYSDKALTAEWDTSFTHPGGEESLDVPVYVKAMDGVWTFVSDYDGLVNAVNSGANIWLTDNVDCQGNELFFGNNRDEYASKINGGGYMVSNIKVKQEGTLQQPGYTLFGKLLSTASIVNVKFENVQFEVNPRYVSVVTVVKAAGLALSASDGCVIDNVSVTGTYVNNTSFSLDKLNDAFYESSTVVPTAFTVNITEKVG